MHGNFPARDKKKKDNNTSIQVDQTFIRFLSTFRFDNAVELSKYFGYYFYI